MRQVLIGGWLNQVHCTKSDIYGSMWISDQGKKLIGKDESYEACTVSINHKQEMLPYDISQSYGGPTYLTTREK